jgi:uncharacterized protein related to proFAR isomerase
MAQAGDQRMCAPVKEACMIKAGIDQDAITELVAKAGVRQAEAVRKAVYEATLKALQGRELTLENIRRVLKAATVASSAGAEQNPGSPAAVEALLAKAVAGMDAALLKAVQANRTALQQFMDLGVGLQNDHMQAALANLGRVEEVFITVVGKVMQTAGTSLQTPWMHVLRDMKDAGTHSGAQAALVVRQIMEQSSTALQVGRAASVRAAQAMMESYSSLVSGVLIGMSEGLGAHATGAHGERHGKRK